MTNLFIDFEFTGLHKTTSPISLGIISENENDELEAFYAEFTDYPESEITSWIRENVLTNLGYENINLENVYYVRGTTYDIYAELKIWLQHLNDQITVYADVGHYDFVLFIDLFGDAFSLPEYIAPAYVDVNTEISQYYGISIDKAFDVSREDILEEEGTELSKLTIGRFINYDNYGNVKHNALYDACVVQQVHNSIT